MHTSVHPCKKQGKGGRGHKRDNKLFGGLRRVRGPCQASSLLGRLEILGPRGDSSLEKEESRQVS